MLFAATIASIGYRSIRAAAARRQNALNHNCFKIFNSTTHSSAKESSIASPHHYETEEYPTPSSHVLPFSPHNYSAGEATQFQINNTQVYEQRNPAIGTTSENASSQFSHDGQTILHFYSLNIIDPNN